MPTKAELRSLTEADIFTALHFCAAAGWNQTEDDWRCLLKLEPDGCFGAFENGVLLGTATTARYEPASGPGSFAWIGMMLVDRTQRCRGIGSDLFGKCVAYLDACGVETIRLDATALGKKVYDKFGFDSEYGIERYTGIAQALPALSGAWRIAPLRADEIEALTAFDALVFGARRKLVLESWRNARPECALVARIGGIITGYSLARDGARFQQIGPIVGNTPELCEALLREALAHLDEKNVLIDVVAKNAWAAPLLERCGLVHQRPFTRMFRGPNAAPGQPGKMLAICCPELG